MAASFHMNNINGDLLTIEQAAQRLNLGLSTVRRLAKECGAAVRIGRSYRIVFHILFDYVQSFKL